MNFYHILGTETTASKQDIKKAYHQLALLYHPDKNDTIEAKKKFQDIQMAYEILYDESKRKEYDHMTKEQRAEIYDLIKGYFTEIRPEYSNIYTSVIKYLYEDEENIFKKDINNFNVKNIFNRFVEKIHKDMIERKEKKKNSISLNIDFIKMNNNLIGNIYTTLSDKYDNRLVTIEVSYGDIKKNFIIPTNVSEYIIHNEGYEDETGKKGDIIVQIICENDLNFIQMNEHDLIIPKTISLSQFIYGGKIKITLPNGENMWFEFPSCIEKKLIFVIPEKGLFKNDEKNINRGDLYIYFNIEGIGSINNDKISCEYSKTIEDILKLLFPPIQE
jgi:DnaJ-class molecular chaperone